MPLLLLLLVLRGEKLYLGKALIIQRVAKVGVKLVVLAGRIVRSHRKSSHSGGSSCYSSRSCLAGLLDKRGGRKERRVTTRLAGESRSAAIPHGPRGFPRRWRQSRKWNYS